MTVFSIKKRLIFLILMLLLSALMVSSAQASGRGRPSSGGLLMSQPPLPPGMTGYRGSKLSITLEDANPETCREYTWQMHSDYDLASTEYSITVAVYDNTFLNGNAEVLWDTGRFSMTSPDWSFPQDSPWIFYLPGRYRITLFAYADGSQTATDMQVWIRTVTEGTGENALLNAVNAAASACRGSSDFETALNINDYLCRHVTYDESMTDHTPEGALLRGTCVCTGYARAFQLIGRAAGLQVRRYCIVDSDIVDNHTWNAVRIDGEWTNVDVTWNDDFSNHFFFGVPDSLICLDHDHPTDIDDYYSLGWVSCTSLEPNYYLRTGTWNIIAGDALSAVQSQIDQGLHRLEASCGHVLIDEYGQIMDSENQWFYVDLIYRGVIAAYALSEAEWERGPTGETFPPADFTYVWTEGDEVKNTISAVLSPREPRSAMMPSGLRSIEAEAFSGVRLHYVYLPDGCDSVGESAFAFSGVWEAHIPSSVTSIADNAFDACPGLEIFGSSGSAAESWALRHGVLFHAE